MALSTVRKIKERLTARPAELAAAREKGARVVSWLSYNIPEEVIYALGLVPVRLGTGGDDRLVEIGGRYISTKNCVFVRETVGLFAEQKDPYIVNSDLVAFDATCLQLFRTAEVVQHYFGINTLVLGVPRNFYWPEAGEYFRKELGHFVGRLEELAGTRLDRECLSAAIELYKGIRGAIKELYRYQAAIDAAIGWREVYDIVQAGFYLDRAEFLELLQELLAELAEKQGEPVIGHKFGEARIFLSGSVIPPGDRKLIEIIEKHGGRIVGDDLWSGLAPYLDVEIGEPTVERVADAYLGRVPHAALPYLDLETDGRLKNLKTLVKGFQAQGVINHTLRYCDPFTFKAGETKDELKKEGVPMLEIHTEYAGSDFEAIRTRVEAFVEMLRYLDYQESA
ncbi:MAG TPA: 2-hydroxyacyl-CoA dehydratase family protein [Desulfuromonadaceae bacterium]